MAIVLEVVRIVATEDARRNVKMDVAVIVVGNAQVHAQVHVVTCYVQMVVLELVYQVALAIAVSHAQMVAGHHVKVLVKDRISM